MKKQDPFPFEDVEPEVLRFAQVINMIQLERRRQDDKWGWPQNKTYPEWMTVLGEEYGESCKAALDCYYAGYNNKHFVEEVVQVAAVAIAILESIKEKENV